jgi:hypothetical protein
MSERETFTRVCSVCGMEWDVRDLSGCPRCHVMNRPGASHSPEFVRECHEFRAGKLAGEPAHEK